MNTRIRMFGMEIDAVCMEQAVFKILGWTEAANGPCRYVVTPNVNHVVKFQEHADLRKAYARAALVLADGKPVVLSSRLLGRPLPETVPGSDLVPAVFRAAQARGGFRAYLLGAAPGIGECAAAYIEATWPAVQVVGIHSPPFGFEKQEVENRKILERIAECRPDLLVVGLGAPKQEVWVYEHANTINARVALCVGAAIDFLGGEQVRAPLWMRKLGIEWLHRMLSDPRRLFMRYVRDFLIFPRLIWKEWRSCRSKGP